MSIIGEPFAPYVDQQIKVRQEQMGKLSDRGPEMIAWANSKTAWVKLASGVSLSGSFAEDRLNSIGLTPTKEYMGEGLAKNYILFGGTSAQIDNNITQGEFRRGGGQEYLLSNKSSFKDVYDYTDTDFGLVPMPGIESIDVKDKNRGSIKEATINIVAYSRKQLEILDILYLRLGYIVLLEWGNSHYINNNGEYKSMGFTLCEKSDLFFSNTSPKSPEIEKKIKTLRQKYNGNYDGILAKVVNFNWTFQPDGSYKIALKLISLGDIIESFKMNVSSPNVEYPNNTTKSSNIIEDFLRLKMVANQSGGTKEYIKAAQQTQGGNQSFGKKIAFFLPGGVINVPPAYYSADKFSYDNFIEAKNDIINKTSIKTIIDQKPGLIKYEEGIEYEFLVANSNVPYYTTPQDFLVTTQQRKQDLDSKIVPSQFGYPEYYFILEIMGGTIDVGGVDKDVIYVPQKTEEDGEEDINEINNYYIRFQPFVEFLNGSIFPYINGDFTTPLTKINLSNTYCKYMPNQISFDPRVCIISAPLNYPNNERYVIFPELERFTRVYASTPNDIFGDVSNVYLNFGTIIDSLNSNLDERGDISPSKFLNDICDKLNKSLGGINNLEPVISENTNEIIIVDSSLPSKNIDQPQTPIQIYGYSGSLSNFVRNVNLKTEISPEFASMITIGSTAAGYSKGMEATAFSKWNKGIVDRFKQTITSPPSSASSSLTPQEEIENNYNQYLISGIGDTRLISLGYKKVNSESTIFEPVLLDSELIDTNISIATEFFKHLRAKTYKDNPEDYASTSNGFIPFNMALTLDGISGIKIYNKIEVDTRFLPYNYPETLKFIVKRVSHKLSNGDWETTIETTVMPGSYSV